MEQEPISYPLVSILYCVKCNWILRASWYQQELLQTFTSKASTADESLINSIILRPSFIPGTFQVLVKKSADADWVLVWDRIKDGGFPEAKALKQSIRNVLSPETKLGHSDKSSNGTLLTKSTATNIPIAKPQNQPTESELKEYGSPKLAAVHKTFCEECIEQLPPTWEM